MKLYQAETHCHTMEVSACSRLPAKYLVEGYAASGYRYVFLTDHYHEYYFEGPKFEGVAWEDKIAAYRTGYNKAIQFAQGTGLTVLPAMELTLGMSDSEMGADFLVYGADREFLLEYPELYKMSYSDFYELAKKEGLLVFQAHPYRYGLKPVMPICYDGIEMINAHSGHLSHNKKSINFVSKHNLYVICGSDTHSEEDIGRGGVMLPGDIESAMDFVQYIRENGSPELIVTFGA